MDRAEQNMSCVGEERKRLEDITRTRKMPIHVLMRLQNYMCDATRHDEFAYIQYRTAHYTAWECVYHLHEVLHVYLYTEFKKLFYTDGHFPGWPKGEDRSKMLHCLNVALDWFVNGHIYVKCPDEYINKIKDDDMSLLTTHAEGQNTKLTKGLTLTEFKLYTDSEYSSGDATVNKIADSFLSVDSSSPGLDNLAKLMSRLGDALGEYSFFVEDGIWQAKKTAP